MTIDNNVLWKHVYICFLATVISQRQPMQSEDFCSSSSKIVRNSWRSLNFVHPGSENMVRSIRPLRPHDNLNVRRWGHIPLTINQAKYAYESNFFQNRRNRPNFTVFFKDSIGGSNNNIYSVLCKIQNSLVEMSYLVNYNLIEPGHY